FPSADERFGADRDRDVERPSDLGAEEVRTGHADHRVGDALDRQRLSDRVSRPSEVALPEPVADDGDGPVRSAAASIVSFPERAPENRRYAEHVEEPPARPDAVDEFRLSALREIEARARPGERAGEAPLAIAKRFPHRIGPGRWPIANPDEGQGLRLL